MVSNLTTPANSPFHITFLISPTTEGIELCAKIEEKALNAPASVKIILNIRCKLK